uniref:ABC transporter domain-containing protein n=1 Tax=Heterorhabditis bacteriophora TaxID=37862 RepID=A0A1I7WZF4_HETBA
MGNRYPEIVQAKRVRQVMRDVGLFTANSVCCFQSVLSRQFQLGLKGSANSLIGTRTRKGLSGGEKKRLAFASEVSSVHCLCRCHESPKVVYLVDRIYLMAEGRVAFY